MCLQCVLNYHYLPSIQKIIIWVQSLYSRLKNFIFSTVQGMEQKSKFLTGQKSVKPWLRYLNCSFKDINQCFGEKNITVTSVVSQTFWFFAIALQVVLLSAEIHKLFWREKDCSHVLGLEMSVNTWKFVLIHFFSFCGWLLVFSFWVVLRLKQM